MISGETMRCCKVKQILRYYESNKPLFPEKIAHHEQLLFHPFRDKERIVITFSSNLSKNLQEEGIQDVLNINKTEFDLHAELVDQKFDLLVDHKLIFFSISQFNENLINN